LKLSSTETEGRDGSEGSIEALIGSLCSYDPPFAKAQIGTAKTSVAVMRAEDNRSVDAAPAHFLMKTLSKVAGEMALSVLAYNLTRVMNIVGIKPLIAAIAA
jgi:hypothetical protein